MTTHVVANSMTVSIANAASAFHKLGHVKSWHVVTETPNDLHHGVREFLIDRGQVPYDINDDAPLLFNATYLENDQYAQAITIVDETTALCSINNTHDYVPLPDPAECGEFGPCSSFDLANPTSLDELLAWVHWCHPQHSAIGQQLPAFYNANQIIDGLKRDGLRVPDGSGRPRFKFDDRSFLAYDFDYDVISFFLSFSEVEFRHQPSPQRMRLDYPAKAISRCSSESFRGELVRRFGFSPY